MASLKTIVEVKEGPDQTDSEGHSVASATSATSAADAVDAADSVTKSESESAPEEENNTSTQAKNTEEEYAYTRPIEDPLEKAYRYLSKHDILPLFQVRHNLINNNYCKH